MTEFFDQGDKERNELKIQPQVWRPEQMIPMLKIEWKGKF